jgi:secondary thiamine-phosphate synthase enzyme
MPVNVAGLSEGGQTASRLVDLCYRGMAAPTAGLRDVTGRPYEDERMSSAFTTRTLDVTTGSHETVADLTTDCAAFLRDAAEGRDGLLNLFVPHATAGIAILETGAGSEEDLLAALRDLLPADNRWHHRHGPQGHGRDHVLPALVPPHATLPVVAGRLELGTWQSVCLVDTNISNPNRQVRLSFLG